MRRKNTNKKAKTKTAPVTVVKTTLEGKPAAVESEPDPVAVEVAPAEEAAAPMPVAEPVPVESAAGAEAVVKDEKPAKKRGIRKPKNDAAEPVKKPRVGRKAKAESGAAEPVKKGRTAKKAKPAEEPAPEEKKPRLGRRSKVDMPAELGVFVQFQGGEVDVAVIAEAAKADFKATNKRAKITSLKLYVKPEESTAYYVVNDSVNGKVTF